MSANEKQVGGSHYKTQPNKMQHWDIVIRYGVGYLEAVATKYLCRHPQKNGLEDLEKAVHYGEKLLESIDAGLIKKPRGIVPIDVIAQFSADYELGVNEDTACVGFFRWTHRQHVLDAIAATKRAIIRVKNKPTHEDHTGQSRPFGFDASQEVKD